MSIHIQFSTPSIERWKTELPLANLTESIRMLYALFQGLQEATLPPQERFNILCAMRQTIQVLSKKLNTFYATRDILSEDQITIYELNNNMLQKMLEGFQTVIHTIEHPSLHPVLLLQAVQNAMYYCKAILFNAYQTHQQPKAGMWKILHHLYLLAQHKHLLHLPLPRVNIWSQHIDTVQKQYKHILLFSIANPYHLRNEQVEHLIYALEAWLPFMELNDNDKYHCLYFIDCQSDNPPRYTSMLSDRSQDIYYLQIDKAIQHLSKLITDKKLEYKKQHHTHYSHAEYNLPLPFLNTLLSTWQQTGQKISTRHKVDAALSVTLTIASIHWLASDSHRDKDEEMQKRYIYYTTKVIDESETGYCLEWQGDCPKTLQSGEIIGITQHQDGKTIWTIGVIRWTKQQKNGPVTIGVQKIGNDVLAVTAKPTKLKMPQLIPTLLMSKVVNNTSLTTLITPLLPFKIGQEIEIHYQDKKYLAELRYTREQTLGYQEFELEFLYEALIFPADNKATG